MGLPQELSPRYVCRYNTSTNLYVLVLGTNTYLSTPVVCTVPTPIRFSLGDTPTPSTTNDNDNDNDTRISISMAKKRSIDDEGKKKGNVRKRGVGKKK